MIDYVDIVFRGNLMAIFIVTHAKLNLQIENRFIMW